MLSSTLKLSELNDFLLPAQDCIKPLLVNNRNETTRNLNSRISNDSFENNSNVYMKPNLIKRKSKQTNKNDRTLNLKNINNSIKHNSEIHSNITSPTNAYQKQVTGSQDLKDTKTRLYSDKFETVSQNFSESNKSNDFVSYVKKPLNDTKPSNDSIDTIAEVSLNDCLACSGCVTTSEVILQQQQSTSEFLSNVLQKPLSAVSVSPQSRTALAKFYGLNDQSVMKKLTTFFKLIGVDYCLDTSLSEAICLLESQKEFISHFRANSSISNNYDNFFNNNFNSKSLKSNNTSQPLPILCSHCPGWICYAEKNLDKSILPHISRVRSSQQIQGYLVKSLLLESHNCTLFLRNHRLFNPLSNYLIKFFNQSNLINQNTYISAYFHHLITRRSSFLLPDVELNKHFGGTVTNSTSKLSDFYNNFLKKSNSSNEKIFDFTKVNDIYHTCIMPCFYKKVEATRPEFHHFPSTSSDIPDVDTVLATSELKELIDHFAIDFINLPESEPDNLISSLSQIILSFYDKSLPLDYKLPSIPFPIRVSQQFGGSGGYVEALFRYASKELFGVDNPGPLNFKIGKNRDFKELCLVIQGKVVLRFAIAYGFRNIQNIVKKINDSNKKLTIKSQNGKIDSYISSEYHYVELMACPGGCLNGGGQFLVDTSNSSSSLISNDPPNDTENKQFNEHKTVNNSSPWSTDGSVKLQSEREYLENLEKQFHSDDNLPYCDPSNLPLLESILFYLKRDNKIKISSHLSCYDSSHLITEYKSFKSTFSKGDESQITISDLKW